jgi:predicted ATPase
VTLLTLNSLPPSHGAEMIAGVTGGKALPRDVVDQIIDRTDGVPLFIEELTKTVVESGILVEAGDRYAVTGPGTPLSIPSTLEGSLLTRLDRLPATREVAQIGAALGRSFSHELVSAVAEMPQQKLDDALVQLVRAELMFRRGTPPDAEYTFKHALVQNTAYGTLLRSRRQQLHARIAATIGTQFPETAISEPELLAHHFTHAGLTEAAIEWWGKAGRRSLERSALAEAIAQFTRALDQIAILPATPALRHEEIKLQVELITPTLHVKGYAAPESKAVVERANVLIKQAEILGEPTEDPLLLFSVVYGFWITNLLAGDEAREHAAQFLDLAGKQSAPGPIMAGHRLMGTTLLYAGDFAGSHAHLDRAMKYYDLAVHRSLDTRFGQDIRVSTLCHRSWTLWYLGYPNAALVDADDALKDAREIGHAATLMYALCFTGFTYILCGDYAAANARVDEAIPLAEGKGAALWKAWGMFNQGWVLALTGKALQALEIMAEGISAWRSTGAALYMPLLLSALARCYAELGRFNDAWRHIGEAITRIKTTKETWCEAETNRIAGEIALRSPEPDTVKAQAYFERALAVARQQQAKSWELRAAMSLAWLWRDQGKGQQARELLAPVYGWFTEGFDTLDLKEAKALLDVLEREVQE